MLKCVGIVLASVALAAPQAKELKDCYHDFSGPNFDSRCKAYCNYHYYNSKWCPEGAATLSDCVRMKYPNECTSREPIVRVPEVPKQLKGLNTLAKHRAETSPSGKPREVAPEVILRCQKILNQTAWNQFAPDCRDACTAYMGRCGDTETGGELASCAVGFGRQECVFHSGCNLANAYMLPDCHDGDYPGKDWNPDEETKMSPVKLDSRNWLLEYCLDDEGEEVGVPYPTITWTDQDYVDKCIAVTRETAEEDAIEECIEACNWPVSDEGKPFCSPLGFRSTAIDCVWWYFPKCNADLECDYLQYWGGVNRPEWVY